MNAAVVYYSLEGNTKTAATKIAEKLGADIIEIKPVKAYPTTGFRKFFHGGKSATFKEKPGLESYEFDADKYDIVLIGTPLWAGTITPPVRTFLSDNSLSDKKVAAFISCGGGSTVKGFDAIKELTAHKSLLAELTLVNPLSGAEIPENEDKITAFCNAVASE